MAVAKSLDYRHLAPWACMTMAPLRCAAKFIPSFPWIAPPPPHAVHPGTMQGKKGSNFAIWQPCESPLTNLFAPRTTTVPSPLSLSSPPTQATVTLQSPRAALSRPTSNSVSHVDDSEPGKLSTTVFSLYFVVYFEPMRSRDVPI